MKPSKRARELFLSYNLPQWPGWESSVKVVEAAIVAAEREAWNGGFGCGSSFQAQGHYRECIKTYDDWRQSHD